MIRLLTTADARPARRGPFSALAHRDFRIYWIGQAISLVGAWMQTVAQGWVVVGLTDSARTIATIGFVSSIPMVAFSLHGGLVADRFERRRVLIVTQLLLALLAFAYAALVWSGHLRLVHVYALAAAIGAVIAFDLPAASALAPELVPPADIPDAVALNQAAFHAARFVGPSLAAILIAATGTAMAFVANGVSYFAVILSLAVIRPPARKGGAPPAGLAGLAEGLRYVRGHREVRALIGFTGLTTVFIFPFIIVFMPLVVKAVFHGDAGALGTMMSAAGLGALGGALSLLWIPARARGRVILVAGLAAGAALLGVSFAGALWLAVALMPLLTFAIAVSVGLAATIIQVTVPDALRGRVLGIHVLMWTGLMPVASLALGALADAAGLRTTLTLMAAAYVTLALPWLLGAGVHRAPRADAAVRP